MDLLTHDRSDKHDQECKADYNEECTNANNHALFHQFQL
jgi:hypothetical protein